MNEQADKHMSLTVKRFWRERVKRTDTSYPTTYNIYLQGFGKEVGKIMGADAPRTLEDAERILASLIESPDTEWTYGIIYEVRPLVRRGTEYKKVR